MRVKGLPLLAVLLVAAFALMGAARVRMLIHRDPGFQGDWSGPAGQVEGEPVPYWHEGTNRTWVRVDLSPGTNVLYVYYGSEDAPDESDGEAVFEFFDDFDGSELDASKWQMNGAPTLSFAGGILNISGYTGAQIDNIMSLESFGTDVVLEAYVNVDYTGMNAFGLELSNSSLGYSNPPTTHVAAIVDYSRNNNLINLATMNGSARNAYGPGPWLGGWEIFTIRRTASGVYFRVGSYEWTSTKYLPQGNLHVLLGGYKTDGVFKDAFSVQVDWVRIRKCVPYPPAVSYGPEEAGDFLVDGYRFTKRKRVEITSNVALTGYQFALDYAQWGMPNVKIKRLDDAG